MIPTRDQLALIAHMSRGDLSETPYPVLLHALAVHRRSVVLEIQKRQLKKEILIEDGMPVECHSNLLHETLGRFMVNRGDLTEGRYQLLWSKAVTSGQSFADVLVSEGWMSAPELYKVLQQNLAKKLLDGFSWQSGDFRLLTDLPKVESPLKVKTAQLVVTGVTKLVPDDEVRKALTSLEGKKLRRNPQPPHRSEELRLSEDHQLLLELLSVGRTLKELEEHSKMRSDRVWRLAYSLAVVGIVIPEEWLPEEPIVSGPDIDFMVPMPEPIGLPETEVTIAHPESFRNELMEAYLRHRKLDAFELLGASEDASADMIEQKYIEFAAKFAPWRFDRTNLSDLADQARDLFLAGTQAFAELADPGRRQALVTHRRAAAGMQTLKLRKDQALTRADLLDSEEHFKKGKALMDAGRYADAIPDLQFARDWDPQNAQYRSELAYCRYLGAPDRNGEESLRALNEALRIDPQCGLAVYYTGMIHRDRGNSIEAEVYLQAAMQMLAPGGRPTEAWKALQASKQDGGRKDVV